MAHSWRFFAEVISSVGLQQRFKDIILAFSRWVADNGDTMVDSDGNQLVFRE